MLVLSPGPRNKLDQIDHTVDMGRSGGGGVELSACIKLIACVDTEHHHGSHELEEREPARRGRYGDAKTRIPSATDPSLPATQIPRGKNSGLDVRNETFSVDDATKNESGSRNPRAMPPCASARISFLVILAALTITPLQAQEEAAVANIKTTMGGSIFWHLEDDFEQSRNMTFTLISFWDKSEIAYEGTGIDLALGKVIELPAGGLTYADRFGNLRVRMGESYDFMFPNKFVVAAMEGDFIEGWFNQTVKIPVGVYSGNASIVGVNGGDLQRSAFYGAGGVVTAVDPNGYLQRCEMAGPSPVPCEVYTTHYRGIEGPNPTRTGFFTTFSLPRADVASKWYRGKVRNRNSPRVAMRPIMWITDSIPGKTNSFMVPAWDRDGDPVTTFIAGSKQGSPGSDHILCQTGNMTSFGCFGPANTKDGPPYDSVNFLFSLDTKVASANKLFFYSFTMNVTDGYGAYALSEVLINYCNPVITIGQTVIQDRAPEFYDHDASGKIVRRRPRTFMECTLAGPCQVRIFAARFPDPVSTTPQRHPQQVGNLEIQLSGASYGGHLGNQTTNSDGSVFRNFTFGKLPHGHFDLSEIGSHRVMCFTVVGHTECKTPPLCITVKVLGSPPRFLAPTPPMLVDTDDIKFDVITPTPVCAGFSVSFEVKASDPDAGEHVTLDIYDNTGDGQNIFEEPFNANRIGNFTGTTEIANALIKYELDYAKGVQRDPITRAVSFARSRYVCTVAVDNTLEHHAAFGDDNNERPGAPELYRGNFISRPKCHEIAFSGPPAFLTSASRFDGSPMASFDGTVEDRMRTIDAFIGVEKSITFRAKDPNFDGHVTILIMEDPGIPNGALIGPSTCEPQTLAVSWNASGIWSECAIASRNIKWTPAPDVDFTRKPRICAITRDSTPIPECANPKMTDDGWYGEEHCTEIRIIPPQMRWTNNSELGPVTNIARNVFVPCSTEWVLEAEETGYGYNNTGILVQTPYKPVIILTGDQPSRASLTQVSYGRTSRSILAYTASRGDEGRVETFCFTVRDDQSILALETTCLTVSVKRCVYCVNPGDTLQRVMQEVALDFNWLRLWAANGNDDGDVDTTTVYHPDDLMKSNRQHIINVGSIYTVEKGDNLAAIAVKFQTTVKQIISLNPDVGPVSFDGTFLDVELGQPLCIVPCTVLPRLSSEDDAIAQQ